MAVVWRKLLAIVKPKLLRVGIAGGTIESITPKLWGYIVGVHLDKVSPLKRKKSPTCSDVLDRWGSFAAYVYLSLAKNLTFSLTLTGFFAMKSTVPSLVGNFTSTFFFTVVVSVNFTTCFFAAFFVAIVSALAEESRGG
ncbi:hypothetical protein [Granulicella rosea]|uniref:hypothetical protein n=1 Tax=Granulicella rosea TaxID=474952 RepID=UPI001C3D3F4A|nr:hypothetical protein [Granulicella rosea]